MSSNVVIPKTMKALWYSEPRKHEIKEVPVPECGEEDVLVKVLYCGICGTDAHIHDGEFISKFPLIPGHEVSGIIVEVGPNVKGLEVDQQCVADNCSTCDKCFFCRRGRDLLCEDFVSKGVTTDGGFAEYAVFHQSKIFPLHHITPLQATLIEPAACAIHGLDRLSPPLGCEVLLMGAGPTGLILAQLLRLNGAVRVVLVARKGVKMDVAKRMGVADVYVELERGGGGSGGDGWDRVREMGGFDVVIEATGVEKLANDAINYVRRGGTLMIYGVYQNSDLVHWPPSKIFQDEIKIIGSFAQTKCFPRAVQYLDSGKINVDGMITDVYKLEDYQKALDKMNSRQALKIAIQP